MIIKKEMTDHELADHLKRHNALNNYRHVAKSTQWFAPDEACVALVFYDNTKTERVIYLAS